MDVLTSQLDGTTEIADPALLDRAAELERVLFSQDEDVLAEVAKRQRTGQFFCGLLYAHQLGITIGKAISDLEVLALCGNLEDFANRVEYLPL